MNNCCWHKDPFRLDTVDGFVVRKSRKFSISELRQSTMENADCFILSESALTIYLNNVDYSIATDGGFMCAYHHAVMGSNS